VRLARSKSGISALTTFRGLHGYTHEHVNALSEQQERDVLAKSIDILTEFTGKRPKGWTAPSWKTSRQSIKLLEEFGIVRMSNHDTPHLHLTTIRNMTILLCITTRSYTMHRTVPKPWCRQSSPNQQRSGWSQ
jgi:peptidoglycan/xylan/chitin deacetylase (PgdA/CDA1 family)